MITSPIRLLCLDIDGTLLDSMHRLPPENRAAVRYAANCGVTVCLLSARPPRAVFPIQKALDVPGPLACYGGGLILSEGKRLSDCRIPTQTALRVVEVAARYGVHLSVYRDFDWFVARRDRWSAAESGITGLNPQESPLEPMIRGSTRGAHKLLCMGERAQIGAVIAALKPMELPLDLSRSKDEYLEIVPTGTGKETALKTLCRDLRIPLAQVMSLGDHDIDCGLLRASGVGVAMANASPAAKKAASCLTDTNDRAGVAKAIYRWIKEESS